MFNNKVPGSGFLEGRIALIYGAGGGKAKFAVTRAVAAHLIKQGLWISDRGVTGYSTVTVIRCTALLPMPW
ncbi:hypothetical protein RCH07_001778 [Arthrobacter sp. CG_A4]|nr:hypothetical protein [Arthrobacter sp. CG_A4]